MFRNSTDLGLHFVDFSDEGSNNLYFLLPIALHLEDVSLNVGGVCLQNVPRVVFCEVEIAFSAVGSKFWYLRS